MKFVYFSIFLTLFYSCDINYKLVLINNTNSDLTLSLYNDTTIEPTSFINLLDEDNNVYTIADYEYDSISGRYFTKISKNDTLHIGYWFSGHTEINILKSKLALSNDKDTVKGAELFKYLKLIPKDKSSHFYIIDTLKNDAQFENESYNYNSNNTVENLQFEGKKHIIKDYVIYKNDSIIVENLINSGTYITDTLINYKLKSSNIKRKPYQSIDSIFPPITISVFDENYNLLKKGVKFSTFESFKLLMPSDTSFISEDSTKLEYDEFWYRNKRPKQGGYIFIKDNRDMSVGINVKFNRRGQIKDVMFFDNKGYLQKRILYNKKGDTEMTYTFTEPSIRKIRKNKEIYIPGSYTYCEYKDGEIIKTIKYKKINGKYIKVD